MDLLTVIASIPGAGPYLVYLPIVALIASAIAAALPAPPIGAVGWYPIVYGLVNVIALNLGHARNAAGTVNVGASVSNALLHATLAPPTTTAAAAPPIVQTPLPSASTAAAPLAVGGVRAFFNAPAPIPVLTAAETAAQPAPGV